MCSMVSKSSSSWPPASESFPFRLLERSLSSGVCVDAGDGQRQAVWQAHHVHGVAHAERAPKVNHPAALAAE